MSGHRPWADLRVRASHRVVRVGVEGDAWTLVVVAAESEDELADCESGPIVEVGVRYAGEDFSCVLPVMVLSEEKCVELIGALSKALATERSAATVRGFYAWMANDIEENP